MQAVGIIAEYNPFHNGHAYQIAAARALSGRPYVIAVMSGDFVQRGEVAILEKRLRTQQALLGGADMVLLLPVPFALSCAERFAEGAVRLLAGAGLVDTLCFGSECGDLDALHKAAYAEDPVAIREALNAGRSLAVARATALGPNDILGLEYIRAIERNEIAMRPLAVKRQGVSHDAVVSAGGFASASMLRKRLLAGESVEGHMPQAAVACMEGAKLRDMERLSPVVLYALRQMSRADIARLPDVSEGLENPIYRACREATSYGEFLHLVKSRRYTLARLRRIAMCALLGLAEADSKYFSGLYIRVLGLRSSAKPLLSALFQNARFPVVVGYSEAKTLRGPAAELQALDMRAAEIACLAGETPARFDYGEALLLV